MLLLQYELDHCLICVWLAVVLVLLMVEVMEVLVEMVDSTRGGLEVWAGVGALGDRGDPLMMGTTWEGAWEEVQWGKGGGDFNYVQ